MIKIKKYTFNEFQECSYLVWDETSEAAVIDPGFNGKDEKDALYKDIEKMGIKPKIILLTHGHFDHIHGVKECSEHFHIPVYMHPADKPTLQNADWFCSRFGIKTPDTDISISDISDGDILSFGKTSVKVLHTPGHTPGCVCYLIENERVLFSGDTLFAGSIGRTDQPGGDYDLLMDGINGKLMVLDGDIEVHPGHGPSSSIADERTKNPFLQPFNLPYDEE